MTITQFVQLTVAFLTFGTALLAYLAARKAKSEVKETKGEVQEARQDVHNLRISIDGRMDQLLETTGAKREAIGAAAGRAEVKADVKEAAAAPTITLPVTALLPVQLPPLPAVIAAVAPAGKTKAARKRQKKGKP